MHMASSALLASFPRTLAIALVTVALLAAACDDPGTEPGSDLVVFVDNPESMQAGVGTPVRVVVVDPGEDEVVGVQVGLCLRPASGVPCIPDTFVEISPDPHVSSGGTAYPAAFADPAAIGVHPAGWQLIACARDDPGAELHCSSPVTVQVRPNIADLCFTSLVEPDSIVPIEALACTIDGEETTVAYLWLEHGPGYGLFFYDGAGGHVPGGGWIDAVLSFDGYDQQRTTIAGMGDGFAPGSTGGYWVVIGGVQPGTEGFAAISLQP